MFEALQPCPFCGNKEPYFERIGTPRQSCIVVCGNCGCLHESSDEGLNSGRQWNERTDPWRQAVDDALIAHALDCTGPGDDPKEKVKELIEWAVTIATDPRVAERAALALQPSASAEPGTAAREQEASATGAEPAGIVWPTMPPSKGQSHVLFEDGYAEGWAKCLDACKAAIATTTTTGKVDASRVRDEAWQPIETAPNAEQRDMFVVRAFNVSNGFTGGRNYTSDAYCVWRDIHGGFARWPHQFAPTHWMPLPAPPVGTPKSAEGEGA